MPVCVCDIAAKNKLPLFCTHKDVNVLISIKLGQSTCLTSEVYSIDMQGSK